MKKFLVVFVWGSLLLSDYCQAQKVEQHHVSFMEHSTSPSWGSLFFERGLRKLRDLIASVITPDKCLFDGTGEVSVCSVKMTAYKGTETIDAVRAWTYGGASQTRLLISGAYRKISGTPSARFIAYKKTPAGVIEQLLDSGAVSATTAFSHGIDTEVAPGDRLFFVLSAAGGTGKVTADWSLDIQQMAPALGAHLLAREFSDQQGLNDWRYLAIDRVTKAARNLAYDPDSHQWIDSADPAIRISATSAQPSALSSVALEWSNSHAGDVEAVIRAQGELREAALSNGVGFSLIHQTASGERKMLGSQVIRDPTRIEYVLVLKPGDKLAFVADSNGDPAYDEFRALPEIRTYAQQVIDRTSYQVLVGQAETLYKKEERDASGLLNCPDGNFGARKLEDGSFDFFVPNGANQAMTRGTPKQWARQVVYSDRCIQATSGGGCAIDHDQISYLSGGPILAYVNALGQTVLVMMLHSETWLRGGSGNPFNSEIRLGVSRDQGLTFQDLGVVVRPEYAFNRDDPSMLSTDVYNGAYVKRTIGGESYIDMYFGDRRSDSTRIQVAAARAKESDLIAAVEGGLPVSSLFKKFSDRNAFDEPGVGGKAKELYPAAYRKERAVRYIGVASQLGSGQVVLVTSENDGSPRKVNLFMFPSVDGVTFPDKIRLTSQFEAHDYPTVLGVDGETPADFRNAFDIYYTSSRTGPFLQTSTKWLDAASQKIRVRFNRKTAGSSGTTALVE